MPIRRPVSLFFLLRNSLFHDETRKVLASSLWELSKQRDRANRADPGHPAGALPQEGIHSRLKRRELFQRNKGLDGSGKPTAMDPHGSAAC